MAETWDVEHRPAPLELIYDTDRIADVAGRG